MSIDSSASSGQAAAAGEAIPGVDHCIVKRAEGVFADPTVLGTTFGAAVDGVREQAGVLGTRLRRERVASFRALVADADSTLVVVARFLALLELYRDAAIAFEQAEALGELTVRWTGPEEGDIEVDDEFDEPPPTAPPEETDE